MTTEKTQTSSIVFVVPASARSAGTNRARTFINLHEFLFDMLEKGVSDKVMLDVIARLLKQTPRYATRRSESAIKQAIQLMFDHVRSGGEPKALERFFPKQGKSKDPHFIFSLDLKPVDAFAELFKELTAAPPVADAERTAVVMRPTDASQVDTTPTVETAVSRIQKPAPRDDDRDDRGDPGSDFEDVDSDSYYADRARPAKSNATPIVETPAPKQLPEASDSEDTDPGHPHVARIVGDGGENSLAVANNVGVYARVRESHPKPDPDARIIRGKSAVERASDKPPATSADTLPPRSPEGAKITVLTPEQQAQLRGETSDDATVVDPVKPKAEIGSQSLPPGEPIGEALSRKPHAEMMKAAAELRALEAERVRLVAAWRQYRDHPEILLKGFEGGRDLYKATHAFLFGRPKLTTEEKELVGKLGKLCGLVSISGLTASTISDYASEILVALKDTTPSAKSAASLRTLEPENEKVPPAAKKETAALSAPIRPAQLARVSTPPAVQNSVGRNELDAKLDGWLRAPVGREEHLILMYDIAFELHHFEACVRILVAEPTMRQTRGPVLFKEINQRWTREPKRMRELLYRLLPIDFWQIDPETHCADLALELDRNEECFLYGALRERGGISKLMFDERAKALAVGRAIVSARDPAEALETALVKLTAAMKTDLVFQVWVYSQVGGFFTNLGRSIRKLLSLIIRR